MKKILASIEKVLTKKSNTIRQDVVRRAIERGEFELIKCAYHMTDDYAWDAVNNFGYDKNVSKESMLKEYSILTPSCWISGKKIINGVECHEISISFHSNLAYDMYVPVDGKTSKELAEEKESEEEQGEFEYLNFIIDHEDLDFTGYEFEGKEIFVEEIGDTQSLFRMDVAKETNEITVYSAYSQDYDVMEEVTHLFDTKKLFEDIQKWIAEHEDNIDNHGAEYIAYYFAKEQLDMEDDDASVFAWEAVHEEKVYVCTGCEKIHEQMTGHGECCEDKLIDVVDKEKCFVYICNECDEMHGDKTNACEHCPSESVREVHKYDLDMPIMEEY